MVTAELPQDADGWYEIWLVLPAWKLRVAAVEAYLLKAQAALYTWL